MKKILLLSLFVLVGGGCEEFLVEGEGLSGAVLQVEEEQPLGVVGDFDGSVVEVLEVVEEVSELIIDEPEFVPLVAPIVASTPVVPKVKAVSVPVYVEPEPEPVIVQVTEPEPVYVAPAQTCCKTCRKGKACGDSCISRSYTCHKAPGCACNG